MGWFLNQLFKSKILTEIIILDQVFGLRMSRLTSPVINMSCMIVSFARPIEFSIAISASLEELIYECNTLCPLAPDHRRLMSGHSTLFHVFHILYECTPIPQDKYVIIHCTPISSIFEYGLP